MTDRSDSPTFVTNRPIPHGERSPLRELDVDDERPGTPRIVWYGRLVMLVVMTLWVISVVLGKLTEIPTVLHLTVILFHEAGHVLFMPFGEALRVAGGTLGQLLMPMICAVALVRRGDRFGAAVCLAWMGMSLVDAAVYAYDAADPVLPLIGGGTGADRFHDFVFLFDRYGQLDHARGWARAMKTIGSIGALAALAWAALVVRRQADQLIE